MGLQSSFGRAIAGALKTARKLTTPANSQAADGIVYRRPATSQSVSIDHAGLGRYSREDENDDDAIVTDDKLADFLIAVDDLVLDDERVEPLEGDTITYKIQHDDGDPHASSGSADLQTITYRVMRPNIGEPAWRYTDATRSHFRIHAQLVLDHTDELTW